MAAAPAASAARGPRRGCGPRNQVHRGVQSSEPHFLFPSRPSPGLVQRCVIIQKDQHGFGFTVSGDRIVLVQSVRPGEVPPEKGGDFGVRLPRDSAKLRSGPPRIPPSAAGGWVAGEFPSASPG